MWTVSRCIMSTTIRLLLLICPLFFFLSNVQKLKFFITLFSGTVRPRKFKLGTLVDNGWMYHVYQNQAAAAYLSLYFFIFLSLQLSDINIFHQTFLRNSEVYKIEIWYTCEQSMHVSYIQELGCCCCLFVPILVHFSFSPIFSYKFVFLLW